MGASVLRHTEVTREVIDSSVRLCSIRRKVGGIYSRCAPHGANGFAISLQHDYTTIVSSLSP